MEATRRSLIAVGLIALLGAIGYADQPSQRKKIDASQQPQPVRGGGKRGPGCDADQTIPAQWIHVHVAMPKMAERLAHAADRSPTLRQILHDLECSDVVAYVRPDPSVPPRESGTIAFDGYVDRMRAVQIAIAPTGQPIHAIVNIAHQLVHALEIARDPRVIDEDSFMSAFVPRLKVTIRSGQLLFDTPIAAATAHLVENELAIDPSAPDGPDDVRQPGGAAH